MSKLKWVAFYRDVPSPSSNPLARGNWLAEFPGEGFDIVRNGDTVSITSNGTGKTFVYPWEQVAGAEEMVAAVEEDDGTFIRQMAVPRKRGK